ncbi:peroxisome biogenesis protein 6 isoform X1 [Amborella trichopoda]|uniref:peroxisome biogenesis protein 6 isoform X1 n=1 Tax=Amborella trichopoda TaxID=13333 RepID=UPI0005D454AD|nr:peroxisome biogenesis protein 6 isoform X1 [Amborella trichopoda]|eukprot:XP_011626676.1 peroxisome biogenesis protein 6 isoform X1 [Amborella trichopoda]
MVERRKPLLLSTTKEIRDSLVSLGISRERENGESPDAFSNFNNCSPLHIGAGILRVSEDWHGSNNGVFDDSSMVGVSASVLKKLSLTSGSLVAVKSVWTNIGRIARVVVLDPPNSKREECIDSPKSLPSQCVMAILPSHPFPSKNLHLIDHQTAYLTPLLAFNIGLQKVCLNVLIHGGQDLLGSLFEEDDTSIVSPQSTVYVELSPYMFDAYRRNPVNMGDYQCLPRFASHLRVSFVKIPECGILNSLRCNSSIEAETRQELIDKALQSYFKVDRFLAKDDVISVSINWNCNSVLCIACSRKTNGRSKDERIYFKVISMEPLYEEILRVNCHQTALVLGGSVASSIPPDSMLGVKKGFVPLHGDVVKVLASIVTPSLCPSVLTAKFKTTILLHGPQGCGKRTIVRYVARCLGLHVVEYSCHDFVGSTERKTSVALAHAFRAAQRYSPSILLLRRFDAFGTLSSDGGGSSDKVGVISDVASVIREFTEFNLRVEDYSSGDESDVGYGFAEAERISQNSVLLVAIADTTEGLAQSIRRCFSHEIAVGSLSEAQRVKMISQSLQSVVKDASHNDIDEVVKDVVGQTSGFLPRDVRALVADAGANLIPRLHKEMDRVDTEVVDDGPSVLFKYELDSSSGKDADQCLGKEDLLKALDRCKKRSASELGTPKVPNVKWEDVGGLEDVKKSILDTVQLPLMHKDLFSSGLRKRSGVLLYGPPGTGKTLLAKAVATECSLNFLSVKGPELINMYIGESEKNVRDIFQKARSARPCVIFFDELDALAPARGASGDSGGVMDRVVSQMLAEIDGLNEATQDLFIIGASNRPDLIDPALLRPGRFDKLLYVGVNSESSYRERVLGALTRKFKFHENVSLLTIAKKCPANFTGADMYALCADAWFHAAKRQASVQHSESASMVGVANSVIVELDDFIKVLGELSPSLSMAELQKYERLRNQFQGTSR